MDILAPVNTLESAEALISAGASEIYLGADEELFNSLSFTGRGKYGHAAQKVLSSFNDVDRIVEYAHAQNAKVNFLCNYQFFCDGQYNGKDMNYYLDKYIERGIEAGVDSIVVSDIGVLEHLSNRSYPVELHASVYFKTVNEFQLLFLKELGVKRTVLSYHITMDEIVHLASKNIMDLEVIGYLGCSFYNGACSFLHDYGEGVLSDFKSGVSCKCKYKVNDGVNTEISKIFDVESGCALCVLGKLDRIGVKALKIVGRERDYRQTVKVIELYSKFLNYYRDGKVFDEISHEIPRWWSKLWCSKKRCKYNLLNNNYKYMTGV